MHQAAKDGSANAPAPTQALPGSGQAEIRFYIREPEPSFFTVFTFRINATTTFGDVLTAILGAPGDNFDYGVFLSEAITTGTDRDTRIEESCFYGRLSGRTRFAPDTLLMPLIERYSKHVVIFP